MCFRLLGASLPLLSEEQLQLVMRGDLIRHFGEHTVISKVGVIPFRFTAQKGQMVGSSSEDV